MRGQDGGQAPGNHWGAPGGAPGMHNLSVQVAKVRAKTRPWKSIIALVLAIAAAAASGWARAQFPRFFAGGHAGSQVIAAATAVAFCVFASAATIGLSGKARDVLQPAVGTSHSAVVRYALVLIGAVTTLVVTLVLFDVPVGQLLLGGALTSVFVGIAAQQALSNVFAGLVLRGRWGPRTAPPGRTGRAPGASSSLPRLTRMAWRHGMSMTSPFDDLGGRFASGEAG